MFVSAAPALSAFDLVRPLGTEGSYPSLDAAQTWAFSRGCGALDALLRGLALGPGQGLLAPSYLCRDVVDVFESSSVPVTLYGIDACGRFDPAEIARKITPAIRAVYLVHYFGFPQQVHQLRRMADAAGILLIEDCAHSLFGRFADRWLGEYGDASVFSLRKTLPLPDGGALVVNNPQVVIQSTAPKMPAAATARRTARLLMKSLLVGLQWRPQQRWRPEETRSLPSGEAAETATPVIRMSATAGRLYRGADVAHITTQRRANFRFYLDRLREEAMYPELPDGVVPFSFPVLIDQRDAVAAELAHRGLSLNMGFPEAPVASSAQTGDADLSGARLLAARVLELPVHQDLQPRHLAYVLDLYRQVH